MAGERYNEEFKIAAVNQVTEGGHSISDVAKRLLKPRVYTSGVIATVKMPKPIKKNNPPMPNCASLKPN